MGRLPVLALSVSALSLFPGLQTTASAQASDILFKSQGAQEQIADPALPADYRDIVRLYASGAHAEALAALGGWTEARIRKHVDLVKAGVVTIRSCAGCPTRAAFAGFPLRAALLLHADREIQQHFPRPISEQLALCGAGPQSELIDHLSAILILVDPTAGEFLRPFYLGMARQAQWSQCFAEFRSWATAGLKAYPAAAPLRLAAGIAFETVAFVTLSPAPANLGGGAAAASQREQSRLRIREFRESALRAFQDALTADPRLVEARLRLGRMQWRLGQAGKAKASFESVLANDDGGDLQYLAHLFLGRLLEDEDLLDEAEGHYQSALQRQPMSTVAAVALSHALFLRGDTEGSRKILDQGLDASRRRTAFDPWVSYLAAQTNEGEMIFVQLRRGLTP